MTEPQKKELELYERQKLPTANDNPIIHHLVQKDLEDRLRVGIETYGQPLRPFNGRDVLIDVYQELLDAACYIRQTIYERDGR